MNEHLAGMPGLLRARTPALQQKQSSSGAGWSPRICTDSPLVWPCERARRPAWFGL